MGNDLTKQFSSDDGYEVTVTIRKVAPGEAGGEEEEGPDQNGNAASGHTNGTTIGTETEDEEPARRSGRKRGAELATPAASAPGPSTSVKQVKNSVGRPKKLAVDSPASPAASAPASGGGTAAGGDGFETPRGRRSTCITVGDTVNPSLDIQIIKSHLAPNYLLTLPADFVKKYFKDNQAYELVGGGTLKIVKHSATRFTLDKKFWSTFVQENNLGLKDGLHLELVGEALIRIDVFKAPLDMALQDEGAAAAAAEAAAAALLSQQQEDLKTDTVSGEAPAMVFAVDQTSDAQQC